MGCLSSKQGQDEAPANQAPPDQPPKKASNANRAPPPEELQPAEPAADKKRSPRVDAGDQGGTGDIFDSYTFREELGRGAFSIVKLAINKETGAKVAVKVIDKTKMSEQYKKNLQMETDILRKVRHPNIIQMNEIYETDEYLFLVMEMVTGGELFDKIIEKGCYTEGEAAILVRKIVSAIDYLHDLDICHRDLKPENLLLASKDEDTEVKIADFGLSKIISKQVMMQTACGTPGYVAPEVLSATGYEKEVDMWSIGVITYILLCGFPPFFGETVPELFEQIMGADYDYPEDYWNDVSDEAKAFIDALLVVEPAKRMTTKQALEHPWLAGGKDKAGDKALNVGKSMSKYVEDRKRETPVTADKLSF